MGSNNYVSFDIVGVKHEGSMDSFSFEKNAEYPLDNDRFIRKIVITADISKATFYLHDSLKITKDQISEILDYLSLYLSNIMIALLKNNFNYSCVLLKPAIRLSTINLLEANHIEVRDSVQIKDSVTRHLTFDNGNEILRKWVQDVDISNYEIRKEKYDILFALLQVENMVQKYMAMYAYLMSLVKEINSSQRETQKQVVRYISDNCSRVEIRLELSHCTRPGARTDENEDQFTALRNAIGHPSNMCGTDKVTEDFINNLASIICCAIEDIPCR